MKREIIYIIILLLVFPVAAFSQKVNITLIDASTKQAIPYANVCSESLNQTSKEYQISDIDGLAVVSGHNTTIISISCIGYKSIIDTISARITQKEYLLEPEHYELSSVVVTGQYKPVSVDKSVYDIKLIGKTRIESKAAVNLAELLSDELSVNLSNDPSTGTGLNLQGISGENIKILIDGVPVIGRLDGNIDLNQLNLNNVSHVEIVEGPMSVVYGSNALGGVVHIITDRSTTAKTKVNLDSYYESVGIYNLNFLTSYRHKNHTFQINAARNYFNGFDLNDSTRSQDWKPKEQWNAGFNYFYGSRKTNIRLKSDYFDERLLNKSSLYTGTDSEVIDVGGKDSTIYWQKTYGNNGLSYTTRFNNQLDITYKTGRHSNINLLGSYSYYSRIKEIRIKDMSNLQEEVSPLPSDHDTSIFDATMLRGVYSLSGEQNKLNVQTGFDINLETGEGKRIANGSENIGDYAVFISLQWLPVYNLTIQPGVRMAYNTKYDAPVTPSANLMYKPLNTTLRASYARGFRSPSLKELYLYFFDSNHEIEGNENLKAERSHNFSLSVNQKYYIGQNTVSIDIKGYYNQIEDKITLVQVDPDNAIHYRNENTGRFESTGIETSGSYFFGNRINVRAGYSYIGAKDEINEKDEFVFSHNGNAALGVNFWKNTARFSVFYRYVGKNPYYFYNEDDFLELGRKESYHNLDASVGKDFWNKQLALSVGLKNIFDNKEIQGQGLSTGGAHGSGSTSSLVGWGRTVFVSLKFNFSQY